MEAIPTVFYFLQFSKYWFLGFGMHSSNFWHKTSKKLFAKIWNQILFICKKYGRFWKWLCMDKQNINEIKILQCHSKLSNIVTFVIFKFFCKITNIFCFLCFANIWICHLFFVNFIVINQFGIHSNAILSNFWKFWCCIRGLSFWCILRLYGIKIQNICILVYLQLNGFHSKLWILMYNHSNRT